MEMEGGIVREIRGDSEEWQRRKIGKGVTETDCGEGKRGLLGGRGRGAEGK